MIRINLLPIKQIKRRMRIRNEVFAFIGGFLVLLAAIAFAGYSQVTKIDNLIVQKKVLEEEKKKYQKTIKEIERIKREKELLEAKITVIKNLKVSSQLPVRVMDEIANLTPTNRLWLNSLSYADNNINMAGTALDNSTIAHFMKEISESKFFSGAVLINSQLTRVGTQKLKSFSLTVQVVDPNQDTEVAAAQ